MSSSNSPSIDPRRFYKTSPLQLKFAGVQIAKLPCDEEIPAWMRSITGPTLHWKVFKKQHDALQFSRDHGEGLMTFAFQEADGTRLFLSAHPVYFWFYDSKNKQPENRRTYEVIAENAVCKLYFDLEFEKEFNPGHDGVHMTNTFIKIISFFLDEEFGLPCTRKFVLDLDSTTDLKFSRHLVFQLNKAYFRDNYHVGRFVKMACSKIKILSGSIPAMTEFCGRCGVTSDELKSLFVTDKHGMQKLFCDEGVYTKNRHFRVYKSTKWNKNSPLLVSPENEYLPQAIDKDQLPEQQIFLDSLITYLQNSSGDNTILEYGPTEAKKYEVKGTVNLSARYAIPKEGTKSPLPVVDKVIEKVVYPGMIRRSTYLPSYKKLIYEISGNRFCFKIGRPHKSNNVFYVVDLSNFTYYQKCHDPDCSGYRSAEQRLPPESIFHLEDEDDEAFISMPHLSNEELLEVCDAISAVAAEEEMQKSELTDGPIANNFPDYGISDADLLRSSTSFC